MATLTDLLAKTVASAAQGVEIPANVQSTVLNGLSDSVLKSLTQTATTPGGVDVLKGLFSGKSNAATSPVTALAGGFYSLWHNLVNSWQLWRVRKSLESSNDKTA